MSKIAKAIVALVTSAVGVGVAVGLLTDVNAQLIVAAATPMVTAILTWAWPNADA
jgi:hypothetical protein